MEDLRQDVRFATRLLLKTPGFACTAILTLAIGIGATTAVFSQINAVFWQQMPVPHPEQLRLLAWSSRQPTFVAMPNVAGGPRVQGVNTYGSFSYEAYTSMRDSAQAAMDLACWANLGEARPVVMRDVGFGTVHFVSGNYFDVLGVRPTLGRPFTTEDDVPGTTAVIFTDPFWRRAFGGDPQVTRRSIDLNGKRFSIVGVTPPGFFGVDAATPPDVLLPINAIQIAAATSDPLHNSMIWAVCRVFGRMRPSTSDDHARVLAEQGLRDAVLAHPPHESYEQPRVWLLDGAGGMSTTRDAVAAPVSILFGAVVATLFIVCANIGGLLMGRSTARQRELATRVAIGASRSRILRQLMTESLLLSAMGGGTGLILSYLLARLSPAFLSLLMPTVFGADRTLGVAITPDARVLFFAVLVTLICGMVFGTVPALRATRADPITAIRTGTTVARGSGWRGDHVMVAVQAGLSLVLLFVASLLVHTLSNLRAIPLGYQAEGLLYARVEPRTGGIPTARRGDYFEQAVRRVGTIPGVLSASATDSPPLSTRAAIFTDRTFPICMPGFVPASSSDAGVEFASVAPRYFETLGTPLLAGREFEWRDGTPNAVAIVNESFAKRFLSGQNPLVRRFGVNCPAHPTAIGIVGVVADAKNSPRQVIRPHVYFPLGATGEVVTLVIRSAATPESLIPIVRRTIAEFNVSVPTFGEITPIALREQQMRRERLVTDVVLAFGAVAVVLAAIGIYGMLSYLVLQRTREIGIRIAIGATPVRIAADVILAAVLPVSIGLCTGAAIAVAAAKLVESLLFEVSTRDPLTMVGVIMILLAIAVSAAAGPAIRAARTDPLRALRFE